MIARDAIVLGFWVCTALTVYAYIGYPVLLTLASKWRPARLPAVGDVATWPSISVVIAAHNEEDVIGERVRNLLALDYPSDQLEILIASDGSSDRTVERARAVASERVRVLDFPENRGKASTLRAAVAEARGEWLLLSDANTAMDTGAAKAMARHFLDPGVGVVCGRLVLVDGGGRNVDGTYWKYETYLKEHEGRLGALLGANGAIYAVRRALFPVLSARIAIDDFVIPLLVKLRSATTIVFEPAAVAYEDTPADISSEFSRRARIGAGGFQSLALLWPLLSPRWGWTALAFLSHKVLRWFGPFFLIGALAFSAAAASDPFFARLFWLQVAAYALSGLGAVLPAWSLLRPLRLGTMFVAMNLALLKGFWLWVSGRQGGTWHRTPRGAAAGIPGQPLQ